MPERSAGSLYRLTDAVARGVLVHPGGPFWAKKDDGAWSALLVIIARRREVGQSCLGVTHSGRS
jgi:predicted NUDIX family NTP pyrophosphohydrolase